MKPITLYTVENSNIALMSQENLLEALQFWGNKIDSLDDLDRKVVSETINVFEDGDKITVDLHRGGHNDENGIHHGGGWNNIITGIYREFSDSSGSVGNGYVEVDGEHVQSISARVGENGFPYRNAQLAD